MNPYEQIVLLIAGLYKQLTDAQEKIAALEGQLKGDDKKAAP